MVGHVCNAHDAAPAITRNPASFRDPGGFVFTENGDVFRAVTRHALEDVERVRATGLIARLIAKGALLPEHEVARTLPGYPDVGLVLRHPRVPFVSYPYEWPFAALQAAALLHLDVQIEALDAQVMLSDASAFNVQFIGTRPVFVDHLSFRPYRDAELWAGHRQYCEQFLHPLLLRSLFGIDFQWWYRGRLEGIPGDEMYRLLRWRHLVRWPILMHVALPVWLQARATKPGSDARLKERGLNRATLRELLASLRRWIANLAPRGLDDTTWAAYDQTVPPAESAATASFVREFVARTKPALLWDLGCNAARYGEVALDAGAAYVVGFDSDHGAVHRAFARGRERHLAMLPLLVDIANPTPSQGWRDQERQRLEHRGRPDAVLALSVVHHIAIARNVPLDEIVAFLTGVAPHGVVGFVPNTDRRAQLLFRGREEIFASYTFENFMSLLASRAEVVRQERLPDSERVLVWFHARS
jgi:ribosomal protein L11 methylase PrmA